MIKSAFSAAAAGAALVATLAVANAHPGEHLAAHANLSIAQVRTTALRAAAGTIESEELETEAGGSGLRYTFDIKTAHGVREVGIDAKTGAILENSANAAHGAKRDADGETSDRN